MRSESIIRLASPATSESWKIPVVYEDDHLLAVNKPAMLLTSPDRYDPNRPNLMRLLHTAIAEGKPWAAARNLTYLMNAHRLDFETSGVILLAKSKPVLVTLANLFGTDKPKKTYAAVVRRVPPEKSFYIDAALEPNPVRIGQMRVAYKHGKASHTHFEVLEDFGKYALLKCEPRTGRTHQIRVHLKHAGYPILGDSVYGGPQLLLSTLKPQYRLKHKQTERPLISTLALHAERLEIPHPITNEPVIITAEWPKNLTVAVKYLRRYIGGGLAPREDEGLEDYVVDSGGSQSSHSIEDVTPNEEAE